MITLGSGNISLNQLKKVMVEQEKIDIDSNALDKIHRCYELINTKADSKIPLYGINTGFGALAEKRINKEDRAVLQNNIILSHAVGVGAPLGLRETKAMTILRLNTLAQGYSGASPALLIALKLLINQDALPYVPEKGSVGASGDLAPLAHLGLLLLGIGPAYFCGKQTTAKEVLRRTGIDDFSLGLRDGLALINGTQAMGAKGLIALFDAEILLKLADIAGASSLTALGGHMAPFDERIQLIKPHPGQINTAKNIRNLCAGNKSPENINKRTQDPYSLRCIPQVHGASKDAIKHVSQVIEREINGVTDNPLIFLDEQETGISILSGGNFHGQSLALVLDYLAMAVAELANISERRIEQLLNPQSSNGLPAFLAANSGLNSGFMMLHVTASALVNENKILCHPASVDSIPTSANREDHVSMGMTSANKVAVIIENTRTVLAIELLAAHQALDFREPKISGPKIAKIHDDLRKLVSFRKEDGLYHEDLAKILTWVKSHQPADIYDDLFL